MSADARRYLEQLANVRFVEVMEGQGWHRTVPAHGEYALWLRCPAGQPEAKAPRQLAEARRERDRCRARLADPRFLDSAPAEIILEMRKREREALRLLGLLESHAA